MTNSVESESLDLICTQTHCRQIAKPYTWAEILENIIWGRLLHFAIFHASFVASVIVYGFRLHSVPVQWWTIVWTIFVAYGSGMGVTAGAHRLWTHRTYKASFPLQIFLMVAYSTAGMYPIFTWVRDHRVHHKFSETDADPHNAGRGFFFSHVGWLMMKRHPECIAQRKKIDLSDIETDPVAVFNKKYAASLLLILCFGIPTAVPVIFWGETILNAVAVQCIRYVIVLNFIWCVNSVAHLWGDRPYNRFINPAENLFVSLAAVGEGSHNYHHTFPWDYKTSEFPYFNFNLTTLFIDGMAKLGLVWDRRVASPELVEKVTRRIGEKSQVNRTN